jgi:trehalose synthase
VPRLREVRVEAKPPSRLAALVGPARAAQFEELARAAGERLAGRRIINVNSTASGGGVAEMLQTLLAYTRGVGIDTRWFVIDGDPAFFEVTKRIHNHLYDAPGDGGELGETERHVYEGTLHRQVDGINAELRPGDVALIHDPQPAGLTTAARAAGARVVWRCHVGVDRQSARSAHAWEFLRPYVADADAFVFTRANFAPPWASDGRLHVIAPSIDPFSAKNIRISEADVRSVLSRAGLVGGPAGPAVRFVRRDGTTGEVRRPVDAVREGDPPAVDTPLVVQVSRWDHMKDMVGVLHAFAAHVAPVTDAHLVLAGPSVAGVTDDPEGSLVFEECRRAWAALPEATRRRVDLVCVPMDDSDENATIVNALQSHAAVVVQKSLAEGFGLTVVEAMWKSRAIVASAVGGIADQITDDEDGLLVQDPSDLAGFGRSVRRVLDDAVLAARLGTKARDRASVGFLPDRHLAQWAGLLQQLCDVAD